MNQLPVAEISKNSPQRALVVAPDMSLEAVLEQLLEHKTRKSIFMVDDDGKLVGIVNLKELLIWGWLQLGLLKTPFAISERKLRRLGRAQSAADLTIPNSKTMVISVETTVAAAMDAMLLSSLDVVAVLDKNGRVVNDLHIEDLLAYALRATKEAAHG